MRAWTFAAKTCLGAVVAAAVAVPASIAQDVPARCTGLCRPNRAGYFVAAADLVRAGNVDGDDLLALVNRTPEGGLAPDYAPRDLVDVESGRAMRASRCVPPRQQCLRREAARAYQRMARAMRQAGLRPHVSSAFRDYQVQCATFLGWAGGGFCEAASASALPGHSQHQLGTAIDLFTRDWLEGGDRFREGYGCSPGGRWLAEHAHDYGFVIPYPLHPDYRADDSGCRARPGMESRIDPRTGYRYEPWHLRYVGVEHAARYHRAWRASAGSTAEITLEQWLRDGKGHRDPIGAPVCDGCNCDHCATFEGSESRPCARPALQLDAEGTPRPPLGPPTLLEARLRRDGDRVVLEASVDVPDNTMTQPPIVTPVADARFVRGMRNVQIGRGARVFAPLDETWRIGIGFGSDERDWPWQAALVGAERDGVENGVHARIPATPGVLALRVPLHGVAAGTRLRVGLVARGDARDARWLVAP